MSGLAHESQLLKTIKRKQDEDEARAAMKAAKPLFDYYSRLRDEIQAEKGKNGSSVTFGIIHRGGECWEIHAPWNWEPSDAEDELALDDGFEDFEPTCPNFFYRVYRYLERRKNETHDSGADDIPSGRDSDVA